MGIDEPKKITAPPPSLKTVEALEDIVRATYNMLKRFEEKRALEVSLEWLPRWLKWLVNYPTLFDLYHNKLPHRTKIIALYHKVPPAEYRIVPSRPRGLFK